MSYEFISLLYVHCPPSTYELYNRRLVKWFWFEGTSSDHLLQP